MDTVFVFIAAPGSGAIDNTVQRFLEKAGGRISRWLAPREAFECLPFAGSGAFIKDISGLPIDNAEIASTNRRKRLLVADMDSTMIRQECIDELGAAAGLRERIAAITAKAMRGELDFAGALRERVSLLKDLPEKIIEDIIRERITYMPGGNTLIATMKASGARTALVSGGFRQFTSRIGDTLGFDINFANELLIEKQRLTGKVREPILGAEAKLETLRRLSEESGHSTADAIAVGDGANDLPMLLEAGMGVALHAKPHVQQAARIRINHGDLTALLYLQGYSREEFAA